MLYGLDVPTDFVTTSATPRLSKIARIGPPAMIPVPAGAVRIVTRPAPKWPSPSWCSVRPSRSGTRIIAFFAAAVALLIASGTSRALPWPKPARPLPSPTTTSAAKPKRLPPFTVLETRLMWTSFSTSSSPPSSPPRPPRRSVLARGAFGRLVVFLRHLELQSALAGSIGQSLDAPVEKETAAVEDDPSDAGGLGALGDAAPDLLRSGDRRSG